jgi:N-acetylglucosaminyldiphosphoundecaprenol N-acetyl-beta-D-mannosaminyltransferase
MAKVELLWLKINSETQREVVAMIEELLQAQRPAQIVTANPEFFYLACKDDELREIINGAAIVTADGIGVIKAAQLLGVEPPIVERVTGSDLFWPLMSLAERRRCRVFLLGAAPGVAERAAAIVKDRHPQIPAVVAFAGFPTVDRRRCTGGPDDPNHELLERLRAARPDLLLVAYGCPKQEKLIHYYKDLLGVPVSIGVGGTLDFVAGLATRAPRWVQRLGLEWAYRLAREPKRIKRQAPSELCFIVKVLEGTVRRRLLGQR